MKYMGSKRAMLQNGLGSLLKTESAKSDRIIDLFCGAASVSWFVAQNIDKPVQAFDLQSYAIVLASAVLSRTKTDQCVDVALDWLVRAEITRSQFQKWSVASRLDSSGLNTATWSHGAKRICEASIPDGVIWNSYGGHQLSPTQAPTFDAMLQAIPKAKPSAVFCRAITIIAASQCAASPGHTAQPFKANHSAGPFLREAWMRCPLAYARKAISSLGPSFARVKGAAQVADAVEIAKNFNHTDLVFVDPPYSGVHYSRFYHVLETIARGSCGNVTGVGRYPPHEERPASSFSRKGESVGALERLFERLSQTGCTVVMTFPANKCSNGLSGTKVLNRAEHWFKVVKKKVKTRFSTLGGNNSHRDARQMSSEMILLLKPKG